jgi:uncharacterized membrane protein
MNVGSLERIACVTAGTLLLKRLFRGKSVFSILGAAVGTDLIFRGLTGECALYRSLGVNTAEKSKTGWQLRDTAPQVQRSITVGKPAEELYALWREPETLSRIMAHFAEVTPKSDGLSHWRIRGPLKQIFEWDSQQTEEDPGRRLSWHSVPGTKLPNHGNITFRHGPDGVGTEVTLEMQFEPPLGPMGERVARALNKVPRAFAGQALRRFKSLAEAGEIPTLEHNPSARGTTDLF